MWGWSHRRQFWRASPGPGERERKKGGQNGSEHVLFLGRCDASSVFDGEECIISIMRASEAMETVYYQGWEFMSMIGRGDNGGEKWLERLGEREVCVSQHIDVLWK